MWELIKNKFKSLQRNFPGEVSAFKKDDVRASIHRVISENWGVYLTPHFEGVARFSMNIMPDESIYEIDERYRESFTIGVNHMSRYIYQALEIDKVLQSFMYRPFNRELEHDLEIIIEDLMVMHEKVMNMTFVDFQTDVIMNIIEGKMFV